MTSVEVIIRARSVIESGCRYGLGRGGRDPMMPHPWDQEHQCDCSGFAAWVLGVDRHTDNPWYKDHNGGWIETSAIVRDARTAEVGMFAQVPLNDAKPGDLYVYGDVDGRQGHVGIISEVGSEGPVRAVHCSRGNENRTGDAIAETGVRPWVVAGGLVARCAWVLPI